MTRKDFVVIAQALAAARPKFSAPDSAEVQAHLICCREVADALAKTNSAFRRGLFLAACGVDPSWPKDSESQ